MSIKFNELKETQRLLNLYIVGFVPDGEQVKADKLVDFVLDSTVPDSAILRNLLGDEGILVLRRTRDERNKQLAKKAIKVRAETAQRGEVNKRVAKHRRTKRDYSVQDYADVFELYGMGFRTSQIHRKLRIPVPTLANWKSVFTFGLEHNTYTRRGMAVPSKMLKAYKNIGSKNPNADNQILQSKISAKVSSPKTKKIAHRRIVTKEFVPSDFKASRIDIRFLGLPLLVVERASSR